MPRLSLLVVLASLTLAVGCVSRESVRVRFERFQLHTEMVEAWFEREIERAEDPERESDLRRAKVVCVGRLAAVGFLWAIPQPPLDEIEAEVEHCRRIQLSFMKTRPEEEEERVATAE